MAEAWKLLLITSHANTAENVLENAGAGAIYTSPFNPSTAVETGWDGKLKPISDKHLIEAFFAHQPSLESLAGSLPAHSDLSLEILPDIDWVSESQKGLCPISAGPFFLYGDHDKGRCPAGGIGIEVNAGKAFGSGHHGTTQGCLQMIGGVLKKRKPKRILDLGCGTGVLAIGLAKATKTKILATDIDPVAVEVTRYNAKLNGVHTLIESGTANGFAHPLIKSKAPYDLIVANILAGPLKRLAPEFHKHLLPDGDLIVSGLLHHQKQAVNGHMNMAGLKMLHLLRCGEWTTLSFTR